MTTAEMLDTMTEALVAVGFMVEPGRAHNEIVARRGRLKGAQVRAFAQSRTGEPEYHFSVSGHFWSRSGTVERVVSYLTTTSEA